MNNLFPIFHLNSTSFKFLPVLNHLIKFSAPLHVIALFWLYYACHIYSSLTSMTDTTNTNRNIRKTSSRNSFNREHAALTDHHAIYKNTFIITSSISQIFFKIIPAIVLLLPSSSPSTG